MPTTKLLFICSGNRDRSPTAEDLFRGSQRYETKSAGTHPVAVRRITQDLIDWAEKIFVMCERENHHLTYLRTNFDLNGKTVYDLDIPDRYDQGSPELVSILKAKLSRYLIL